MSCLVFQSYYVYARLQSKKRSVRFIIKERPECVESTYSVALQKDNSNNNLSVQYVSHLKSHLDASISRRVLEMRFEVEQQCGYVGTYRHNAAPFVLPCPHRSVDLLSISSSS